MHDVFISYSTRNQMEADLVKQVLEKNGVSCWMAPDSIPGGSNYAREIPAAIGNAGVFVLILSRDAQLSKWVCRELDLAVNKMKVIVPFVLEDCEIMDEFNFYLAGAHRVNAYQQKAEALEVLVQRIRAVLDAGAEPVLAAENEQVSLGTEVSEEVSSGIKVNIVPKAYTEESLAAFAAEFIRTDLIQGSGRFRNQNIDALRRHLKVPQEDEIFLAHDATLFRSGRTGFVIGSSGMYSRSFWGLSYPHICWEDFLKVKSFAYSEKDDSDLYGCTPDGDIQIVYASLLDPGEQQFLLHFFERLRDAMYREFGH